MLFYAFSFTHVQMDYSKLFSLYFKKNLYRVISFRNIVTDKRTIVTNTLLTVTREPI